MIWWFSDQYHLSSVIPSGWGSEYQNLKERNASFVFCHSTGSSAGCGW